MNNKNKLISHALSPSDIRDCVNTITKSIQSAGDKPYASVDYQLGLLEDLAAFDFGRFLIQNRGLNGYWTHYMLTHPWHGRKTGKNNEGKPFSKLELLLLDHAPAILATQQRFEIFLNEIQKSVIENAVLASIPCGMLGELLYLNFDQVNAISIVGIDYDENTLADAKKLAKKKGLEKYIDLRKLDAWHMNISNEFDLISSNGLTIYESDDDRVVKLYREFYKALKPGGKLVTSFLTPPPSDHNDCEWDFSMINNDDLLLQKIIFVDMLQAKWQCFRSTNVTKDQLMHAGFSSCEIIYDKAKIFPTVVAKKL